MKKDTFAIIAGGVIVVMAVLAFVMVIAVRM